MLQIIGSFFGVAEVWTCAKILRGSPSAVFLLTFRHSTRIRLTLRCLCSRLLQTAGRSSSHPRSGASLVLCSDGRWES